MKNKKILKVLGATALIGVTTLSLASCSVTDTIKGWFENDPTEVAPTPDTSIDVDGGSVDEGTKLDYLPEQAIFKSANRAVTALTVSASLTPSNATNQTLTWSLAWKTTSNLEVSDYVTITSSGDTHSCSITVKQGFNIPILLTVKSSNNKTASCQLDYLKRIKSYKQDFKLIDQDGYQINEYTYFNFNGSDTCTYSESIDGTSGVGDGLQLYNFLNSDVIQDMNNKYYNDYNDYIFGDSTVETVGTIGNFNKSKSTMTIKFTDSALSVMNTPSDNLTSKVKSMTYSLDKQHTISSGLEDLFDCSENELQIILNQLKSLPNDRTKESDIIVFEYNLVCDYNSYTYSQTASYSCKAAVFTDIWVSSITLNQSGYVFA